MFSVLRPSLIYKNLDSEILEHDQDLDADEWTYNGRDVFRGSIDPSYITHELNVYWLYDDNLMRVGLAEHESRSPEVYKVLWFSENAFETLFQEEGWINTGKTLWTKMSTQAYQDCLEDEFRTVAIRALQGNTILVSPEMLQQPLTVYNCTRCNKKSFIPNDSCHQVKMVVNTTFFSFVFLDDSFIVYEPPEVSTWQLRLGACDQEHLLTAESEHDQELPCELSHHSPLPHDAESHQPQ
jgi:hypothetical protein